MKIQIDTNIYSLSAKGFQPAVEILKTAEKIVICPVVIGELIAGFKVSSQEKKNRELFNRFLDSPRVEIVDIGEMTAEHYGNIFRSLRKIGKPIPTNDMWIAASALEHGIPLATTDKHFELVPGLILV